MKLLQQSSVILHVIPTIVKIIHLLRLSILEDTLEKGLRVTPEKILFFRKHKREPRDWAVAPLSLCPEVRIDEAAIGPAIKGIIGGKLASFVGL